MAIKSPSQFLGGIGNAISNLRIRPGVKSFFSNLPSTLGYQQGKGFFNPDPQKVALNPRNYPGQPTPPSLPQDITMQSIPGRVPGEKGVQFTGLNEKGGLEGPPIPPPPSPFPTINGQTGPFAPQSPVAPQIMPVATSPAPTQTPSTQQPPAPAITEPIVDPNINPTPSKSGLAMAGGQGGTGGNANIMSPDQQETLKKAEKAYQDSLKIGPEELSTQEDIDRNFEEARRVNESLRLSMQNTTNQPIPMEFITGQLKSIEQRGFNRLQTIAGMSEPLERKLARLQAQRTSASESSKFALERADKKMAETKLQTAPKEVSSGASLVKLNPQTGKYESIFSQPKAGAEGFTLGEGQTRYDAQGKPIVASAKTTDAKEVKQQQYSLETANRTIDLVTQAIGKVNHWTTGYGGFLSVLPESDSRELARIVDSIKGNIGFNELQAMRNASPTGGALGQVAVQELNMLQSVLGSLDTKQKPETVKANLEAIKTHFENWKATLKGGGGSIPTGNDLYNF